MIRNLLIDLDGTLLENDMDVFGPAYFTLLSEHLSPFVVPEIMIKYLMAGTQAMLANLDPGKTLENAFDEVFYPGIGIPKVEIIDEINTFYATKFGSLQKYTKGIPAAVELVTNALQRGVKVSIATNPLFPRTAILQRLDWAGLSADNHPYTLISSYEEFHFAKPNPEFYLEFLTRINASPSESMMVGNDFGADITPSRSIGMNAFHVSTNSHTPETMGAYATGRLDQVLDWLENL